MAVFGDTTANFALIDRRDRSYAAATVQWIQFLETDESLVTPNYVVVETVALLQRRLGIPAVLSFESDFAPLLGVHWVDELVHRSGLSAVLIQGHRDLSLVDCVSFEVMRERGITTAFAFDVDFAAAGFTVIP